ncbi:hypothetical protein [Sinorhizobium sp. BG8]|uniref:hypothetical protein n=1 Tax=Sinorhizobium sp. BG8 TaxID=2613773 RepID=UPI00193D69F7|nr:hypothetical protein [Sinorhizobium sp. BG8]QRM54727.1 hypothetical protein F3Y30_09365 [Sinorhizobium sp. BG8]
MYEDNTVFVVGAGASAEFGLPIGWKLLEKIRDNSHFEFDYGPLPSKGIRKVFECVYEKYANEREVLDQAIKTFADINRGVETAGSIDEYINRYSDDPLIAELGKIQIAYAILEAEGKSNLVPSKGRERDGINWDGMQDTWISTFTRALFDGVKAGDVESIGHNIAIICFNYDRCIEHYLEHAIMRAYREVDRKTARKIVSDMDIIHPYGSLGNLSRFSYGTPLENADLYHITKNLITWSETVKDVTLITRMKDAIKEARNIVFLGFAFANQNMELLNAQLPERKAHCTNVYATGFGLSDVIEVKLKKKIMQLYSPVADAEYARFVGIKYNMKCKDFMNSQLLNFTD